MQKPVKAAIYSRYSSDKENRSIDEQIRECEEFLDRNGWETLNPLVYSDAGLFGATLKSREGINALLADLKDNPSPFDFVKVQGTTTRPVRLHPAGHLDGRWWRESKQSPMNLKRR